MDDDFFRETAPAGDLAKPPRKPPTAVGTATADPNPDRNKPVSQRARRQRRHWFGQLISRTLDVVDLLGDAVAESLKLRPRRSGT